MKGKKADLEPVPELPDFLAPLVIEIGVEEMPAGAMPGVLAYLKESVSTFLEKEHLEPSHLFVGGTCRRLVVTCDSILKTQEDRLVIHRGPPEKVLKDTAGNWTPQAEGFAKKFGLKASDIVMEDGYATIEILERGQPTAVLLGRFIREFLDKCPLPKRMGWGDDVTFLRPVRWVLGLVGAEVIPFVTRKLKAGHTTHEPRQNRSKPLSFMHAGEYAENMKLLGVELCPERRKEKIRHLTDHALMGSGLKPLAADQEELLEEINWLVETPHAMLASFDKAFLAVPPEVIRVVLMRHQRYLPLVEKSKGTPANYASQFVVVLDRQEESDTTTALSGHERVVHARLSDALFFWRADSAEPLDSLHRQEKLKDITFHPQIGSLWEKQQRVTMAAAVLKEERGPLAQAAACYRQDRATALVGEFPELEGAVGARLLTHQNVALQPVASAVAGAMGLGRGGSGLVFLPGEPETAEGATLLVLDRLDTLLHFFGVGLMPTATEDPFALRRAAVQLLRPLMHGVPLTDETQAMDLLKQSSEILKALGEDGWKNLVEKLSQFLEDRLVHVLREHWPAATLPMVYAAQKGDAVVVSPLPGQGYALAVQSGQRFQRVAERLERLLRITEDLESLKPVVPAAIRAQNISTVQGALHLSGDIPAWATENPAWVALHEFALGWCALIQKSDGLGVEELFNENWRLAQAGVDLVNTFFDSVLVNDEDPQKRKDNHTLVGAVALLYGTLGDFRELKSLLGQE